MTKPTNEEVKAALLIEMRKEHARLLWCALRLTYYRPAGLERASTTRDYPYRRVLQALNSLHRDGVVGKYTTEMNENVYYLYERDATHAKEITDIPF